MQRLAVVVVLAALGGPWSPSMADGANVLVFMPFPLKSHFGGFQPVFEELARRGHNVTVASPFPLPAGRRVANYTDLTIPLLKMDSGKGRIWNYFGIFRASPRAQVFGSVDTCKFIDFLRRCMTQIMIHYHGG